ncbi:MAG: T9SS type A sorting domain-containing protein, partial [Bacteroidota bacterium]
NSLFEGMEGRIPQLLPAVAEDVIRIDIRKSELFEGSIPQDIVDITIKEGAIVDLQAKANPHLLQNQSLQIFPNPSTDQVFIQFELPEATRTKIWVTDMTGREVMGVFDLPLAQGPHEIEFDVKKLSIGTYILNLQYQNELLQRKMMVK